MAATTLSHSSPLTHSIHWTHTCSIEAYGNTANNNNFRNDNSRQQMTTCSLPIIWTLESKECVGLVATAIQSIYFIWERSSQISPNLFIFMWESVGQHLETLYKGYLLLRESKVQYPGFPYRDSFPDGTRAQARRLIHECH